MRQIRRGASTNPSPASSRPTPSVPPHSWRIWNKGPEVSWNCRVQNTGVEPVTTPFSNRMVASQSCGAKSSDGVAASASTTLSGRPQASARNRAASGRPASTRATTGMTAIARTEVFSPNPNPKSSAVTSAMPPGPVAPCCQRTACSHKAATRNTSALSVVPKCAHWISGALAPASTAVASAAVRPASRPASAAIAQTAAAENRAETTRAASRRQYSDPVSQKGAAASFGSHSARSL